LGDVAQRFVRNPALAKVVANTRLVLSELCDAGVGDLCASEADKIDLLQLHEWLQVRVCHFPVVQIDIGNPSEESVGAHQTSTTDVSDKPAPLLDPLDDVRFLLRRRPPAL